MIKYILLLFVITFLIACENGVSPDSSDIQLIHTGKIDGENYEFMILNNSSSPVWYTGYGKESPLYITSILSDTGWVFSGPGWCGTGLMDVKLEVRETFKFNIRKPNNNNKWRGALLMKKDINEEEKEYWSHTLK